MTSLALRAEHIWQKRHTPEGRQLLRYGLVSVISTAVAFTVLIIVFGVLHLWGEVASTVVANVAGTFPAYYLNRKWVWGKSGRSHVRKEIIPFWGMSALGILVSVFGAALARRIGIEHGLTHREQTLLVLAANVVSFGVFYVLKYLVFNRLFQVHTLEELDERVEALVVGPPVPVPELAYELRRPPWVPDCADRPDWPPTRTGTNVPSDRAYTSGGTYTAGATYASNGTYASPWRSPAPAPRRSAMLAPAPRR